MWWWNATKKPTWTPKAPHAILYKRKRRLVYIHIVTNTHEQFICSEIWWNMARLVMIVYYPNRPKPSQGPEKTKATPKTFFLARWPVPFFCFFFFVCSGPCPRGSQPSSWGERKNGWARPGLIRAPQCDGVDTSVVVDGRVCPKWCCKAWLFR